MATEPYIPEEQTGIGPSAKIYRAHEVAGNRLVRLKVLLSDHESNFSVDRSHLTDRIPPLLRVSHPRVCSLIALDVQAQDMTVVSEFAEGFNAWTFSQLGPFTTERLRVVAVQLLEALQAGEAAHLPHGDVKPCNVLIESRPLEGLCLKLQDWGLGQSRHRQPRETLAFRAPELGPEDAATLAGDVFSAGATLAALCTGHCLIEGRTAEELCPHLDPGLLNWISWLLTLDPAERPATATEALEGLRDPSKRKRRRRAKPQRSALSQFLLLAYNGAVIAGLAWYWLWLTKNPVLELLGKGWC